MIGKLPIKSLTRQILLLTAIMLLIVPISFVITSKVAEGIIEKRASESVGKILLQVEDKSQSFYIDMDGISSALVYSPTVQSFLLNEAILDRILMNEDLVSVFSNIYSLKDNIRGIQLYDKTGILIGNSGLNRGDAPLLSPAKTLAYSGLLDIPGGDRFKSYYSITVPIYNLKNNSNINDYMGACVFIMDTDNFIKILKNSLILDTSKLLLLDGNDRILASGGNESYDAVDAMQLQTDSRYIVQSLNLSRMGWKLISIIPKDELLEDMNIIKRFNIVVYIIILSILCLVLFIFFFNILNPIKELVLFMNSYTYRKRSSRFSVKYDNEIGVLGVNLNKMLDDIDELNHRIYHTQNKMYEMELAKKQMEIISYRNQINPHFLYNTLECIRSMAFYYKVPDIAKITESLSKIFRYTVKGGDYVTLEEEITHVSEYAKIIGFRFMNRIQISIDADDDIMQERTLKMLIQPLVENAVFHGLEKKIEHGLVTVTAKKAGCERMELRITDNGCGMEPDRLNRLLMCLENHKHSSETENINGLGVGISNIYHRIRLYYGEAASMHIRSRLLEGTRVIITLPLEKYAFSEKSEQSRDIP